MSPRNSSTKKAGTKRKSDEGKDDAATINRKTLDELKAAANFSAETMRRLEESIISKHCANINKHSVEDCDNKLIRDRVRKFITTNVPRNKQPQVREAIFHTFYALLPPASPSRMSGAEHSYRSGSEQPPGYRHMCPSDYGSDEEGDEDDKENRDEHASKKRKTSTFSTESKPAKAKSTKAKDPKKDTSKKGSAKGKDDFDLSGIHLDGEETGSVPVFETCDMVRRKMDRHLKQPGVTQASFCRDLGANSNKNVTTHSLQNFRGKKGYDAGNTSGAFYAAYVFFEKLRIKQGKDKGKDRQKMEEVWGERGGFDITTLPHNKGLIMHKSAGLKRNKKYGEATIIKADGSTQTGAL